MSHDPYAPQPPQQNPYGGQPGPYGGQQNPYAPPQHQMTPPPYGFGGDEDFVVGASTGLRFGNFILDSIFRSVLTSAVTFMFAAVELPEVGLLLVLLIVIGYYLVPEYLFGWTPAKLITGTRVVSRDGSPLTFWRVLGRTLCRFVPFEPFSFIGGPPGWHDSWSNTRVIVKR